VLNGGAPVLDDALLGLLQGVNQQRLILQQRLHQKVEQWVDSDIVDLSQ
jgi:hypothetical protein